MEENMAGFGIMAHGVDQMLADKRATKSYNREREMMQMQNSMNKANMVGAPSMQVEGLRMAGFNPAMVNGAGSSPAPTVSKGSSDMAQTIPFDVASIAQLGLVEAQKENIEAQTAKTEAETENIPKTGANIDADTSKKIAETIHEYDKDNATKTGIAKTEAEIGKIEAETKSIQNTNEVFEEENKGVALFGQTMAMDWQKQDWYKSLPSGTKMVIDQVANGNVPLSIGSLRALITAIDTDGNMSKMQKDKAENALASAVAKGMLEDPKVKKALVKMPETQRNKLISETAKIIQERQILKFNYDWDKEKKGIWEKQDPEKLYNDVLKDPSLENYIKWINATINDKINRALPGVASAGTGGYTAGKAMNKGKGLTHKQESAEFARQYGHDHIPEGRKQNEFLFDPETRKWYDLNPEGVSQMKYRKK